MIASATSMQRRVPSRPVSPDLSPILPTRTGISEMIERMTRVPLTAGVMNRRSRDRRMPTTTWNRPVTSTSAANVSTLPSARARMQNGTLMGSTVGR